MTETRRVVEETWDLLAHERVQGGDLSREHAGFTTAHGQILLARDSDGTRHVFVPVASTEHSYLSLGRVGKETNDQSCTRYWPLRSFRIRQASGCRQLDRFTFGTSFCGHILPGSRCKQHEHADAAREP